MIHYYLKNALRNLRNSKALNAVMIFAVALGIAAASTMLTVLHNLSGDPIPDKSSVLFHPQVDPRPLEAVGTSHEPPDNLTWQDATNLFAMSSSYRRALTGANWLPTRIDPTTDATAMIDARGATSEFFSLFQVPFIYGSSWTPKDDDARSLVVVLTRSINQRLFGGVNSVGRTLVIATRTFTVAGVIEDWNPQPHFYDVTGGRSGAYGAGQELFIPFFTWLDLPQDYGYGTMECWGGNGDAGKHNPKFGQCAWVQMWIQLDTASQVRRYKELLDNYSVSQRDAGRFERPPNARLRNVQEWLDYKQVVPPTVVMQTWIAFGMLLVCLVNSIGLLMAKFVRRAFEIGVRRALGATRRAIFAQCLVEAGLIGLLGGAAGVPLSCLGVMVLRAQPIAYAKQLHVDVVMLAVAVVISIGAALLAGVGPAWRASRIAPVLQMKSL